MSIFPNIYVDMSDYCDDCVYSVSNVTNYVQCADFKQFHCDFFVALLTLFSIIYPIQKQVTVYS